MQSGVALLLGGMLVIAGLPKAVAPWYVASALRRVIRFGSDRALRLAGRALGLWELALGVALVTTGGPLAAGLAVLTFTGFVVFVVLAIRRGSACGCWASLSEGPAGGAELGRAVFLAALAADAFLFRLTRHTSTYAGTDDALTAAYVDVWRGDGLVWAGGLVVGMWVAARVGALVLPVPAGRLRRQLDVQVAPGVAGRLGGQLALLGGFVHAGTRAGRRRYLAARLAAVRPVSARPVSARPLADQPQAVTVVRRARTALPPRPPAGARPALHEGSSR